MTDPAPLTAPVAARKPITRTFHGREFVDDYEWLRDKESQDTLDYLNAENAYTDAATAAIKPLAETIYQEIKSRVKETDMSVPVRAGDWWYYGRTEEGKDYGYSCRLPVAEGSDPWTPPVLPEDGSAPEGEEVILDLNQLAEGHDFISLGASTVTTSGRYLAYSVDTSGDERFDLHVKDLTTGELLDDHLGGIFYGATWVGEDYIFYQRVDDAWRPDTVWRHKIGTPATEDVLVYREEDERYNVSVGGVRSEKYLLIESASKVTTETRVLETSDPEGEFELLWEREPNVEYFVDHAVIAGEDRWVVTHNALGPNFSVGECAVAGELTALTRLRELIAHDEKVRVYGVDTYRDFLVAAYRRDAIGQVALMRLNGSGYTAFEELQFEEELVSVGVGAQPEWDAPVVRVTTVSFTQPSTVSNYEVATGTFTQLKRQEVRGGYDPADYTAYRLWATARDGAKIPVSVIHRSDLPLDAKHPTLLYGYGSYESSTDPGFSIARLSLMDRGMIFVIAHVRGGGEMGRAWYENGKETAKKNTFTDFIDVADDLVARGLTEPAKLVAEGGSAGGMLMGAVANMAPEKFAGILAVVPFVDSLTSMLMPELPLTVIEWDEWGNPYHDPDVYDYMASYSPYENVTAQDYPDILAVTSLNDTRVLYVEPAKWIAKLRATATGGQFLLKTEMAAGHGGVSGRYGQWKQTGFEYAWVLATAGAVDARDA